MVGNDTAPGEPVEQYLADEIQGLVDVIGLRGTPVIWHRHLPGVRHDFCGTITNVGAAL